MTPNINKASTKWIPSISFYLKESNFTKIIDFFYYNDCSLEMFVSTASYCFCRGRFLFSSNTIIYINSLKIYIRFSSMTPESIFRLMDLLRGAHSTKLCYENAEICQVDCISHGENRICHWDCFIRWTRVFSQGFFCRSASLETKISQELELMSIKWT